MAKARTREQALMLLLYIMAALVAHGQTLKTLVTFDGKNGTSPDYMSPIQGADGNIYGSAETGGASNHCEGGCGVLFQLKPTDKMRTYSFCRVRQPHGVCPDGLWPDAALFLSIDGNFYGTTIFGGTHDAGVVFKIAPSGVLTTLYNFGSNSNDGAVPYGALIQGSDGNFYGTTSEHGGYGNGGTVFKMTPNGNLTTLHSFDFTDGYQPQSGLVQGTDGNFYGTTFGGGANGDGTLFQITPSGSLATLYNFCSQPGCPDGDGPFGVLIQATDGNLYGTTSAGGNSACQSGCGTVFKITLGGSLTTLYDFCSEPNCTDGRLPFAGLIQGSDGNFYGTTVEGGPSNEGTVFSVTPEGVLTTLHTFCPSDNDCGDGIYPYGGLLQDTSGRFYGSTAEGGDYGCDTYGCGTIFSINTGLGPFVAFVNNPAAVGQTFGILGQGLTGTTSVMLNGTPANFTVVSDTYNKATVPAGATTGYVTVTTPTGVLKSNVPFRVIQ